MVPIIATPGGRGGAAHRSGGQLAAAAGSPAGGAARQAGGIQGPQGARQRQGPQEAAGQRRRLPTLDGASGEGITPCKSRHRHQESLGFLRQIETFVFGVLDIQLSDDHPCTDKYVNKYVKLLAWLVPLSRFHLRHPPYASWLNQLERWYRFAVLRLRDQHAVGDPAGQRLQRRCSDVKELIAKIEQFVAAYNRTKETFNRITTVDSILKKLTQS